MYVTIKVATRLHACKAYTQSVPGLAAVIKHDGARPPRLFRHFPPEEYLVTQLRTCTRGAVYIFNILTDILHM